LQAAGASALLALAVAGALTVVDTGEPERFGLLTRFDERAGVWIRGHTVEGAVFHVNGFPAYGGGFVAGSDGGWWLWWTANRRATVDPAVYTVESGVSPTCRSEVTENFIALNLAHTDPARLSMEMRKQGIDYVYVGARGGRIGHPPERALLDPAALQRSSDFETVYTDDFVWVFRSRHGRPMDHR
jgi:hypothetical protein